jgi:probable H4MPT-linked C1 transfer pathway protein
VTGEPVIGWDLGGAHLKAARLDPQGRIGPVVQVACPLWQGMEQLEEALATVLSQVGAARRHAVTMTGEMVDLFPHRAAGVTRLAAAMHDWLSPAELRFYAGTAGFLPADQVAAHTAELASANWLASATCVAAHRRDALFIDIGSTTIDLIPVVAGQVAARGKNDFARLVAGELLYTGVVRTPLMALSPAVPFEGESVPLMAEYFATTADVYRLAEQLPEGADLHPAADGGEKSVAGSAQRLARMIGRDADSAPLDAWRELAAWFAALQLRRVEQACDRLRAAHALSDTAPVVLAGVGRFLARDVATRRGWACCDFADLLSAESGSVERASDCAPAVAVAWLLQRT